MLKAGRSLAQPDGASLAKDGKVGENLFTRQSFPRPLPVCTARLLGGFCYFWAIFSKPEG